MNRNTNSHFAFNPTNVDLSRSRFDMSFGNKTSFNVGDLIPLCRPIEVLPGDTFSVDTSKVVRLQTLLKPVFSNLYLDTYWFFVPYRLVWSHFKEFMGENTQSAWLPPSTYQIPGVKFASGDTIGFPLGTVADYMGLPIGVPTCKVNALPFKAYALVCNEWFRSENLTDPLVIDTSDSDITFDISAVDVSQPQQGGIPFKAAKFFDYFTACLPAPQKGPDVNIPMQAEGNNNGWIPVKAFPAEHLLTAEKDHDNMLRGYSVTSGDVASHVGMVDVSGDLKTAAISTLGITEDVFVPSNLWALGNNFTCDVNSLRLAFQIQKLYEKDARGGSRYIEILKSHFGVTSPDSRLQRPEYLGGNRIPINITEVLNNTAATSSAKIDVGSSGPFLGDLGAMSRTTDVHSDFTHSFTEHGVLLCLGVARYEHDYSQGIHRSWLRQNRLDFYWPVLANIGEQAVLRKEIFATSSDADGLTPNPSTNPVFGYNERWAEYRYQPNMITGMLRSAALTGLDSWHFGDDYSNAPTLSDGWIREDKNNVDRCLAVNSSVADQIFGDFWFNIKATRCMPVYSIPGLIDHH